jgi:hypothetical protein
MRLGGGEELNDGLRQVLLVVLHRQDVIAALGNDLLGHVRLTSQGIHGDDTSLEYQCLQQRFDRGQLIPLAGRTFLPQRYAQFRSVGADHVQRRIRPVLRSSHRLTVERHHATNDTNDAGKASGETSMLRELAHDFGAEPLVLRRLFHVGDVNRA